jgi:hypothetical protein
VDDSPRNSTYFVDTPQCAFACGVFIDFSLHELMLFDAFLSM